MQGNLAESHWGGR